MSPNPWMATVVLGALVHAATLGGHVGAASAGTIQWEPYEYRTRDGRPVTDGERGRLRVPENRQHANGRQIELSFIRFRSTAAEPGLPIVWLAGGPGDFGSDDIEGPYLSLVRSFQEVADVIALDQRGAGLSRPCLTCPEDVVELPLDEPLDLAALTEAYLKVSRRCAEHWTGQGVDLSAYNTNENADDVESLRQALAVEKINLYGASYGTHLGLAAMRRHPDRIARAILSGVEGPDHTWKLPSAIETHFTEVARAGHEDGGDLVDAMRRVLAGLSREPVPVSVARGEGDTVQVVVGPLDLQRANCYFLGDLDNIRQLREIYAAMEEGDFSTLGRVAMGFRKVSVGTAMYYCMDCASGASPSRRERIEMEARLALSLTGFGLNAPFPQVCDAWPVHDLGDAFRSPLISSIPVLFISGTLDGQTPIQNVSELVPGFRNAHHLIVENASHQYLELSDPEIARVMTDFFRGEEPDRLVITLPPLHGSEGATAESE